MTQTFSPTCLVPGLGVAQHSSSAMLDTTKEKSAGVPSCVCDVKACLALYAEPIHAECATSSVYTGVQNMSDSTCIYSNKEILDS